MKTIVGLIIFVALIANINCYIIREEWQEPDEYPDEYEILLSEINGDNNINDNDENGKYLIRNVRQLSGNISPNSATLGASGNIFNGNGHSLDGHATATRTWKPSSQTSFGGGLNYKGPRGGASVDANHARHFGTDVSAAANANIYRSPNGRTTVDGQGKYNQHLGGPGGHSKPKFDGAINFNHKFR